MDETGLSAWAEAQDLHDTNGTEAVLGKVD
jgi:hypothetical protein